MFFFIQTRFIRLLRPLGARCMHQKEIDHFESQIQVTRHVRMLLESDVARWAIQSCPSRRQRYNNFFT